MYSSSDELDLECASSSKPFDFEEEYEKIIASIIKQSIGNLTLSETEKFNDSKEIQRLQALIEELRGRYDNQEKKFDEYKEMTATKHRAHSKEVQCLQTVIQQLRNIRDSQEKEFDEYKKVTVNEKRTQSENDQLRQTLIRQLRETCCNQEKQINEYKKMTVPRPESEEIQHLQTLIQELRETRDSQENEKFDLYTEITLLKEKELSCDAKMRDINWRIQKFELENSELKEQLKEERELSIGAFQSVIFDINELGGPVNKTSKFSCAIKKSLKEKMVEVEKRKRISLEEKRLKRKEKLETENCDLKMEVERLKEQLMEEKNQSAILHKSLIADFQEKFAQDPEFLKNELHEMEVIELNEQITAYNLKIEELENELEDVNQFISRHLLTGQAPKEEGQKDNTRPAEKLIKWWEKEGKNKRPPVPTSYRPSFNHTPEVEIKILKSQMRRQSEELEFANQQIAMIIENSDLLRGKDASEHAQEVTKLQEQIEELNQTICYFSNQLSDTV